MAGVLVAGYWMINRSHLDLAALCQAGGRYWVAAGWNWRGIAATLIGTVLAVGGAWSAPGQGPFPSQGLILVLKPLYDYSWAVGFGAAVVSYLVLSLVFPMREGGARVSDHQGRVGPAAVDG